MIYPEQRLDNILMDNLMEEFINTYISFHKKNNDDYEDIKRQGDKLLLKAFNKQFPYLSKGISKYLRQFLISRLKL